MGPSGNIPGQSVNYSPFNDEEVLISTAYNILLHYGRRVNGNFDLLSTNEQSAIVKQIYAESDPKVLSYSTDSNDVIRADMYAYLAVMRDIQRRLEIVTRLINLEIDLMYTVMQAESIALQIRMIIESIAQASLSANKSLFEQVSDKFKTYWKALRIFEDIENKNPNFYPKPIKENPLNPFDFTYIDDGFMTRDEIIEVHQYCCIFLHAKNPFAQTRDYDWFIAQFPNWMDRINKLLNNHQIKLLDDDGDYIVTMQDPAMYNLPNMSYRLTIYPANWNSENETNKH